MLTVYTGPMASGKTLRMLSDLEVAENYEGKRVFLLRPMSDKRSKNVESRTGRRRKADFEFRNYDELIDFLQEIPGGCFAGIDEIQLNEDTFNREKSLKLARNLYELAEERDIVITMLNKTFAGEPFGYVPGYLLSLADHIEVYTAVCKVCNRRGATVSMRLRNGKPTSYNDPIIDPGYHYIPVHRKCHVVPDKPVPEEVRELPFTGSNGFIIVITGPPNSGKTAELESYFKRFGGRGVVYFPRPGYAEEYLHALRNAKVLLIDNFDSVRDGAYQALILDAIANRGYGVIVSGINNKGGEFTSMQYILPLADSIVLKKAC